MTDTPTPKDKSAKTPIKSASTSPPRANPMMVLAAGGFSMLLLGMCCVCGGAFWWFKPDITEDPVQAEQMLTELVDIKIPESYQPHGTITWNVAFAMNLRGVYYERFIGDGVLALVEVTSRFRNDEDVRRHMRQTLLEKGGGGVSLVIDAAQTRKHTFIIRGEEIPFTFEIGRDPPTGNIFHLVEGVFEGKQGDILLELRVQDEHWDEQSILDMLQSLSTK